MKKIAIVGAGPGGLTAGMILANSGFEVEIFEKESKAGGRNSYIESKGFKFDIGPTFLMLKPVLEEVFKEAGEDASKWLKFYDLEPMYNLVFKDKKLTDDISFYIRNASKTDKTVAPKGRSNMYVLVPVPNNTSKIDWEKTKKEFRDKLIKKIEQKTGTDIEKYIMTETVITPKDWEERYNVFLGATFNLAHNLSQMLYFRPHNKLSKNIYLAGGGTHPGSGLPTIYESGRITANLIKKEG